MPLYMDIHHKIDGLTAEAIKGAHEQDVKVQEKHGVTYHKYWFDAGSGRAFCLVEAPNKEAANAQCIARPTGWWRMSSSRCRKGPKQSGAQTSIALTAKGALIWAGFDTFSRADFGGTLRGVGDRTKAS